MSLPSSSDIILFSLVTKQRTATHVNIENKNIHYLNFLFSILFFRYLHGNIITCLFIRRYNELSTMPLNYISRNTISGIGF